MRIHPREKREFYHGLSRLVATGTSLPGALKTLRGGASARLKQLIARLENALERGETVPQAFAAARPLVSDLEAAMLGAGERAGRIVQCAQYLASYFDSLDHLRNTLWKKSAYAIFVFHFGVLVLGLPAAVTGAGWGVYLSETLGTLLAVYAGFAGLVLLGRFFQQQTAVSSSLDQLIRTIPLIGGLRKNLVLSRFCATYEMQLSAGVNVFEALKISARASQSALLIAAAQRMQAGLSAGEKPGELMERHGVFPREMLGRIRLGEETGGLDEELARLGEEYRKKAISSVETLGEWLPRLLYVGVLLYSAWQIVTLYLQMMSGAMRVLDQ